MSLSKLIEQKRREKLRKEKTRRAKHIATGLTLGSALGVVSGVLLAPKSGKETREDIKNKSIEVNEKVSTKLTEVKDSTKSNVKDAKEKIAQYIDNKRKNKELVDSSSNEDFKESCDVDECTSSEEELSNSEDK